MSEDCGCDPSWEQHMCEEMTPGQCAACGKDPAEGFAQINDDWYCHPDEGPSCFQARTILQPALHAAVAKEFEATRSRMREMLERDADAAEVYYYEGPPLGLLVPEQQREAS